MIGRIWHGWTIPENADTYEYLLRTKIFPGIAAKKVEGYQSIQLFRRSHEDEVEFITIMCFESWVAVKDFAGENFKRSYVPDAAQKVLKRYDENCQHYEIKEYRVYEY